MTLNLERAAEDAPKIEVAYGKMHVLVIYYDGNAFQASVCTIDDDGQSLASTDPAIFGLPTSVDINAVIVTPDVDQTAIIIEGEVVHGEL